MCIELKLLEAPESRKQTIVDGVNLESCKQKIVDGVNLALRITFLDDETKLMDKGDGSYRLEKVTENPFDSSSSFESTPSCDYSFQKEKEKEESGCETVNPSETETGSPSTEIVNPSTENVNPFTEPVVTPQ
ncbi:hypothetical protein RYX36_008227 [Vicia faba]